MALKAFHNDASARINQLIAEQIARLPHYPDSNTQLKHAMEYALLVGGKRTRPLLAYISADALQIDFKDVDAIALSLEAIHCYSLVHDDLPAMDNDDLRRGQPTCHIKYDEATAILVGDALQSLAFQWLSELPMAEQYTPFRLSLVQQLSLAAGYQGMCGGQALDIAATNQTISLDALKNLHNKKTGALLKAALMMVASLKPGMPAAEKQALATYADAIGLAFQVQDDILDVTSDSATLGKPQGSDSELNKSTFPALLGLDKTREFLQQLQQTALQALQALSYNTDLFREFCDFVVTRKY